MGRKRTRAERRGAVTIYEIAEAAGVHPSTASRALSPGTNDRISAETADRIKRIASELGYEPHPWARSLRTHRTLTIGVILPRLTDGVLARIGEAAEDRARDRGYIAVTLSTRDKQENQEALVNVLLDRRVDGLILATAARKDPLVDQLAERQVPFVLLNRRSGLHPSVAADDELGGYLATRHLLGLGHTRIGMIAGPQQFSTGALRLKGYRRAFKEAGVSPERSWIVPSSFSIGGGLEAAASLLGSASRPTAIFCINDSTAIGVMVAARDLGMTVPDDVALVGYNDTEVAPMLQPPLSSVAIPLEEMGREAVDCLVRQIDGGKPESITLPPRLKIRGSSQ